jgi:hypothetical protein
MHPSEHSDSDRFDQPGTVEQPEHTMDSRAMLVSVMAHRGRANPAPSLVGRQGADPGLRALAKA